jgi:hypothetical protein
LLNSAAEIIALPSVSKESGELIARVSSDGLPDIEPTLI